MSTSDKYTYQVSRSPKDGAYVAICLEIPDVRFLGATHAMALGGLLEATETVLLDMQAMGQPIPEPLATRRYSGVLKARISPDEHRRLAIEAASSGVSLNRLVSLKLSQ